MTTKCKRKLKTGTRVRKANGALCGRVFTLDEGAYFSVEFNPDSTSGDKLAVLARHGVNRVSLGVQSLQPAVLEAVARGYQTRDNVLEALALARQHPFQISVDLLAPLPGETEETFRAGVRTLLAEKPDQLVTYRYQPVWRGGRTFEGDEQFRWPAAAAIVSEEGAAAGYLRVPQTSSSIILERPGTRQFSARYEQHPARPASTLGLGPMAESELFGTLAYVADPVPDGTLAYRGERRDEDAERRNFICRKVGNGRTLERAQLVTDFGQSLEALFPEDLALLEESGLLVATAEGWTPSLDEAARRRATWLFVDRRRLTRIAAEVRRRADRSGRERLKSDPLDTAKVAAALLRRPSKLAAKWVEALDDAAIPLAASWLEVIVTGAEWTWWIASELALDGLAWEGRESLLSSRFERVATRHGLRFDPRALALVARLEAAGSVERLVLRWSEQRLELEAVVRPGAGPVAEWLGQGGEVDRLRLHCDGAVWLERPPAADGAAEIVDLGRGILGVRASTNGVPPLPPVLDAWCRSQGVVPLAQDVFARANRLTIPSRRKQSLPVKAG